MLGRVGLQLMAYLSRRVVRKALKITWNVAKCVLVSTPPDADCTSTIKLDICFAGIFLLCTNLAPRRTCFVCLVIGRRTASPPLPHLQFAQPLQRRADRCLEVPCQMQTFGQPALICLHRHPACQRSWPRDPHLSCPCILVHLRPRMSHSSGRCGRAGASDEKNDI